MWGLFVVLLCVCVWGGIWNLWQKVEDSVIDPGVQEVGERRATWEQVLEYRAGIQRTGAHSQKQHVNPKQDVLLL